MNAHNFFLLGLVSQTCAAKRTAGLLHILQVLLHPFNIFEAQFCRDNFHITDGVDISLNVNDVGVIEGTDHLEDTVDRADVGQESITEASSSRGTLDSLLVRPGIRIVKNTHSSEAGNIDASQCCRNTR